MQVGERHSFDALNSSATQPFLRIRDERAI
jgi:hypothetical protein